jgi:hypothetical protein
MTIERYVEQVPQSIDAVPQQLPIERGPGNFLLFQTSTSNITITLMFDGVREVFANVNGGVYVRRVKPWQNLRIDGAIGTQVTYFVGTENVDRDETDIRQQIAVISGVTATADQPAQAMTDTPNVAVPNGALTQIVPVNNARRRVQISFPSNSAIPANTVFIRRAGGVNNLQEVQAGVVYPFVGFYAISVRNDSGGALTALVLEET